MNMIQETVYIIYLFYLKEADVYTILYERKQVFLHGRRSFSVAGKTERWRGVDAGSLLIHRLCKESPRELLYAVYS
jgi:hypothetical protein